MTRETRRAVCEHCHARCRVLVHSEDNRLIGFEEDRSYPLWDKIFPATRGCGRLNGAMEMMYHRDRVNFPLKRAGEKGEGKWEQISWEAAFDEIAGSLDKIKQEYSAESLAITTGTWRTRDFQGRFANIFGTPNLMGQSNICFGPWIQTSAAIFGWPLRPRTAMRLVSTTEEPEVEPEVETRELVTVGSNISPGSHAAPLRLPSDQNKETKCILAVGANVAHSYFRIWKSFRDAKDAGYKLIVVDPRETQTAKLADLWLQIRPGTDVALLLAVIHIIIKEGLYDREFVENWCYGFDELVERVQPYTPEKAAQITWIPANKIVEAAYICGQSKPFYSMHGMGIEHIPDAIEAIHARLILASITGNIDIPGGHYIPGPPNCRMYPELEEMHRLSKEQKQKQLGSDRFKFQGLPGTDMILENSLPFWRKPYTIVSNCANAHAPSVYRAMITGEPYPVKAAISTHSNPLITQGNSKLVYQALKNLDLYVVFDIWRTPSAELADYILPIASWLERPSLIITSDTGVYGGDQALPSVMPGEYDHKTDFDMFRGLGIRLGQQDDWPWNNLEEVYDYMLEPVGVTFNEFMEKGGFDFPPDEYKKYEKTGFGTTTGKVELHSMVLEKLGYDPLPQYHEPFETPLSRPELLKDYPLMLTTGGRFLWMYHSEHRQIESVRKKHPHPLLQIHPDTAQSLGINNGDWAWIESPRGKIRMKATFFKGINPQVVHCEHGWWFPELPGEEPSLHGAFESNVNVLTDDSPEHCNLLSGNWPLRISLCKVYKAE
jgi:thiosulfate reductase/polysulfide reductase chain A